MTTERLSSTTELKWQKQLNLKPGDPALTKLAAISAMFEKLEVPENLRQPYEGQRHRESSGDGRFVYSRDYSFGRYDRPVRSIKENADAAIFQGTPRAEIWRIMKSRAFETEKGPTFVHLRGDRDVDVAALARVLGVEEKSIMPANLQALGLEYGIVSPFVASDTVRHLFDYDLVEGKDHPGNDMVLTSSGDLNFYVAFDVRRYLIAKTGQYPHAVVHHLSMEGTGEERVVARRPVKVIGGDSGIDTARLGESILESITDSLQVKKEHYGDRSPTRVDIISTPRLAGSMETPSHEEELREAVTEEVQEIVRNAERTGTKPLVALNSTAMDGIAGDMLRKTKGIEYVGRREAVQNILNAVRARGLEPVHTILLGLPSVYDHERSAFAGEILESALPVSDEIQGQIQDFVSKYKRKKIDPQKFYQMIEVLLKQTAAEGEKQQDAFDKLKDKTVMAILGASELESFVSRHHPVPKSFAIARTLTDPDAMVRQVTTLPPNRVRLFFVRPNQVIADMIAEKVQEA